MECQPRTFSLLLGRRTKRTTLVGFEPTRGFPIGSSSVYSVRRPFAERRVRNQPERSHRGVEHQRHVIIDARSHRQEDLPQTNQRLGVPAWGCHEHRGPKLHHNLPHMRRRPATRIPNILVLIRGSIVVSISACHAEDPGSIPGRGVSLFLCRFGISSVAVRCLRHFVG